MKTTFLALALAATAAIASAQSVTLTFDKVYKGIDGHININGNSEYVGIGILQFDLNGPNNDIYTICSDLTSFLDYNSHTYTTGPTGNSSSALDLAGHIVAASFSLSMTNNQAAGLQLAVWDALYNDGGTYTPHSGAFQTGADISSSENTLASNYYATGMASSAVSMHYASNENGSQGQLTPTPEPASLAAFAIGAIGLLRRRKKA